MFGVLMLLVVLGVVLCSMGSVGARHRVVLMAILTLILATAYKVAITHATTVVATTLPF